MKTIDMKRVYRCRQCGHTSPKWLGRCPHCREWDAFNVEGERKSPEKRGLPASWISGQENLPLSLADITDETSDRLHSGMGEWDRVLGEGLVEGSLVLLAGDPGIGKSTLLLQVLSHYASFREVLYVSGEESPQQILLRSKRLHLWGDGLKVLAETSVDRIIEIIEKESPAVVAVDSVQTMYSSWLESAPGSVSQVRECAARLMRVAKEGRTSIFLVGHVTKDGNIAGPRVLEHLVDTVLYMEGDRTHTFRLLRGVKNRFGSTNEIGVFEMRDRGMEQVPNPSQFLLAERPRGVSGSVVVCSMEGTRPLLVELQALVSASGGPQPRRTSMGVDGNRLSLLLAVLEKKLGFSFSQRDVFVNVAGGVKLVEPAADLALTTALMSSYLDRPLPGELVVWGEVGLTGEVRGVGHSNLRALEAQKLGFGRCILPQGNAEQLTQKTVIECQGVRSLSHVLEELFSS